MFANTGKQLFQGNAIAAAKSAICFLTFHLIIQLLQNKGLRRHLVETLSKDAMIELTKSDWLVVKNEYDLYKFCRTWANIRVKRIMGIQEPEPVLGDDKGTSVSLSIFL